MDLAATVVVDLGDRLVTVAMRPDQLAVRGEGDLITAEIISVERLEPNYGD